MRIVPPAFPADSAAFLRRFWNTCSIWSPSTQVDGSEGSYSSTNFMFAAKPTLADFRARSSRSWTFTALRSGGLRLPNCSTCSRSFTIRRVSPTIRSVRSRSSPSRFIERSCAAPVIPASGFLISWASISAMPIADFAAEVTECARPSRSATERLSISSRTKPGMPIIGAIWMLHWTGGLSPELTSTLLMNRSAWSARTRRNESSSGASMASLSKTGAPFSERAEALRKASAAGLTSAMTSPGSRRKPGTGSEAQRVSPKPVMRPPPSERARRAGARAPRAARRSEPPCAAGPAFPRCPCTSRGACGSPSRQARARWDRGRAAAVQPRRHLGEEPRPPLRAAPDHHPVGTRRRQRRARRLRRHDVAVRQHRNRHGLLHRPDRGPVRAPLVELAAGAPVDRDHRDPGRLGPPRELWRVDQGVVPPQPGLQRHRNGDRGHDRLDQGQRVVEVPEERRARIAAHHLLRRAAHVDVDDARTLRLDHPRRLGLPPRLAPGELHRRVPGPKIQLGPLAHAGLGLHHLLTRHHLAHDEARAEARHDPAERKIGYPRHGGEDHGPRQRDVCHFDGQMLNPCAARLSYIAIEEMANAPRHAPDALAGVARNLGNDAPLQGRIVTMRRKP